MTQAQLKTALVAEAHQLTERIILAAGQKWSIIDF